MPHQRGSDERRRPAGEKGGVRSTPGQWRTQIAEGDRDVGSQHQRQAMRSAGGGKQRGESQTLDAGLDRQGPVVGGAQVGILMKQGAGLCKSQRHNQQQPERPGVPRSAAW